MSRESKQYDAFRLEGASIIYKGDEYSLSDIKHLFFGRTKTVTHVNFVSMGGGTESVYLKISLKDGRHIELGFNEAGLLIGISSDKSADIGNLTSLYQKLCTETFMGRRQFYTDQIKTKGHFTYDECDFQPQVGVVFRGKLFRTEATEFSKAYGYVSMKAKKSTLLDRIQLELSPLKSPQFNTQTDTDVIFSLLEENFGLRWTK